MKIAIVQYGYSPEIDDQEKTVAVVFDEKNDKIDNIMETICGSKNLFQTEKLRLGRQDIYWTLTKTNCPIETVNSLKSTLEIVFPEIKIIVIPGSGWQRVDDIVKKWRNP